MAKRLNTLYLCAIVICAGQFKLICGSENVISQMKDTEILVNQQQQTVKSIARPDWATDEAIISIIDTITRLKSGRDLSDISNLAPNDIDNRTYAKSIDTGVPSICRQSLGAASSGYRVFCRQQMAADQRNANSKTHNQLEPEAKEDSRRDELASKSSNLENEAQIRRLQRLLLATGSFAR